MKVAKDGGAGLYNIAWAKPSQLLEAVAVCPGFLGT